MFAGLCCRCRWPVAASNFQKFKASGFKDKSFGVYFGPTFIDDIPPLQLPDDMKFHFVDDQPDGMAFANYFRKQGVCNTHNGFQDYGFHIYQPGGFKQQADKAQTRMGEVNNMKHADWEDKFTPFTGSMKPCKFPEFMFMLRYLHVSILRP